MCFIVPVTCSSLTSPRPTAVWALALASNRLFCGMCVQACPVDALAMTQEFEWSAYDKRDLLLNKQQLLAIGDRNFPVRERRLEFQHPNVAFFNVAFQDNRPKKF